MEQDKWKARKTLTRSILLICMQSLGSGYLAIDVNLPSETILQ